MNEIGTPFNSMFRTDTRHAARHFQGGYRWIVDGRDSNECARAFFRQLDKLFDVLNTPGFVFLSGVELDVEPGRFPELLVQYFSDEAWDYNQSFFIAAVKRTGRDDSYAVGRLTFEAAPGQTVREALEMSPDNADQVQAVHRIARAAWLADVEFNSLALWISPAIDVATREALDDLSIP